MDVEGAPPPLDDKAKRMRDLLSSFYSPDPLSALSPSPSPSPNTSSRFATLDTINTNSFDADQYMNLLVQKSNLEGLLQKHVEMAAEIKNLDTDLQMLVYENYNKFISATDTIKRMKNNIVGMETNMEQLLEKITSVQSRSDGVNSSLFEKREHIEKLHRTRNLLRKVQVYIHKTTTEWHSENCLMFIYDLPARLERCIKSESYADAVKFYTGAMPIFKAYGDSSFKDCKKQSEEAVHTIIKDLQGKVFSDSQSIQTRAEAVMLLKQLDFPVENLKVKLFEKLEQFLSVESEDSEIASVDANASSDQGKVSALASPIAREASIHEFAEAVHAYKVIFLNSEPELSKLAQGLVSKHFEVIHERIKKQIHSEDLVALLRVIWNDVLLMDDVLPEASIQNFAQQSTVVAVKDYISSEFKLLSLDISDALTKIHPTQKGAVEEKHALQAALEASKKAMIQGSLDVLKELRRLLDENSTLFLNLRNSTIVWVLEGFQDFFRKLDLYFHLLSGKSDMGTQEVNVERVPGDRVSAGLVLVLAQFSLFIEHSTVPRITEEIASIFPGGEVRRLDNGSTFVPAETCRIFRSSGEMFLNLYIKMRNQRISVILKRRFVAPNWVKHKEPREVHMFVDLLFKEFEEIRSEVKQILPQSLNRKHRRADSNGSTTSSRSNPLRDDRFSHSNTQKAKSQLLESHLAKLFKQKMEIFTKVEHTQESVVTTIVKLSLKSLQEFVRIQTFNRSGFQQILLDIHFLKSTLKDIAEDEAAVDFLLDEVIVGTAERCLDPVPLEPPILDRLVQAKLSKSSEQDPVS